MLQEVLLHELDLLQLICRLLCLKLSFEHKQCLTSAS